MGSSVPQALVIIVFEITSGHRTNYRLNLSSDSIRLSFTRQVVLTTGKKEVAHDRNVSNISICLSKCLAVEREHLLLIVILN